MMRLENQESTTPGKPQLSASELEAVLSRAIAMDGQQNVSTGDTSLEEAVAIARELGIPEERVRLAAAEIRAHGQKSLRREERRAIARQRRRLAAKIAVGGALALTGALALVAMPGDGARMLLGLPILGWLTAGWLAFRGYLAPISDAEADAVELPPVNGLCRVCGQPATTPRATFCEEHRYKGPG